MKPTEPSIGQYRYWWTIVSELWQRVLTLARSFEDRFQATGELIPHAADGYDWYNRIYTSSTYRRAHVEIVDRMQSHKILVLHCTIFPHYTDPSPIWGFDAVCGPNKITGAFHDMSSGGDENNELYKWFAEQSAQLTWKKPRELPEWAREIFSPHIIAAGNINDSEELESLCQLASRTLDHYLVNVGRAADPTQDFWPVQSRYNRNNKLNPHVARSMISMGVPEPVIMKFIDEVLYPEYR